MDDPETAKIANPHSFRFSVLEGLYKDAQKGRGTDLEVIVPTGDDGSEDGQEGNRCVSKTDGKFSTTTFHLHHNIVAASSHYFATFPEPKSGRMIGDVDSESFSFCLEYMYMGYHELSLENVAPVLHAAELLQIDGLKQNCIAYLDRNLDHSNYEQVIELADRFNSPKLKKNALRFQSENSCRDALMSTRESLVKEIGIAKYNKDLYTNREKELENQLKTAQEQLQRFFLREREEVLSSNWEKGVLRKSDNLDVSTPFSLGSFRKSGAVGHLVYSDWYVGSSIYGENVEKMSKFGPPPPTKEQYEKYGIVHAHDQLMTAIEKANPGDRIYLAPGIHAAEVEYGDIEKGYEIMQAQEFIGLGDTSEVIIETEYAGRSNQCFRIMAGPVGFYNITFRVKAKMNCNRWGVVTTSDHPGTSQGSGDEPIISIEEDAGNYEYETPASDFLVKNCMFDMGIDCSTALPTRVSGIFLKRGKSATIEGCSFLGGAGSAIVVANDPFWRIPSVEISRNTFVSNGQPYFSEKSADKVCSDSNTFVPIPESEITPGPSSVEIWKFDRTCHIIKESRSIEKYETLSVNLTENQFRSNLRAPIAYRLITPKTSEKQADNWKLYNGRRLQEVLRQGLVQGFDPVIKDNIIKSNGLQFGEEAIRKMLHTVEQKEEKARTEEDEQSKNQLFPDGHSLLAISQTISQSVEGSFPTGWGGGEPLEDFCKDYTIPYFDDDDDDSYYDEDDDSYYDEDSGYWRVG